MMAAPKTLDEIRAAARQGRMGGTQVKVVCSASLVAAIDRYAREQDDLVLRPKAMRRLMRQILHRLGYLDDLDDTLI